MFPTNLKKGKSHFRSGRTREITSFDGLPSHREKNHYSLSPRKHRSTLVFRSDRTLPGSKDKKKLAWPGVIMI